MSALGSKAERQPKSRFQSLDINNLYCTSRGDTVEQLTQKSSVPRKHGMQSLGKVPTARRPPANLPSIRAEATTTTSSNTTIVNSSTSTSASASTDQQQQQVQQQQSNAVPNASGAVQTSWATDSKNPAVTQPVSPQLQQQPGGVTSPQQQAQQLQHSNAAGNTWSAVAVGAGLSHQDHHHSHHHQQPPSYQSPQFQHEFPSLDGHTPNAQTQKPRPDAQYGPGPSLRPQTEGSWIQGGRSSGNSGNTDGPGAPTAVAPAGGPPAGGAGAPMGGQALQQVHPHFQAIMPSFMYRGNGGTANNFGLPQNFGTAQTTARNQARPQNNYNDLQGPRDNRRGPTISKRDIDLSDTPLQRPIIKEEDLDKMEDIARDVGWAAHDDIDYNQKLAFSDDESPEPTPSPAPVQTQRESSRESSQSQSNLRATHSSSAPPASTSTNDSQSNQRQISPAPLSGKVKSGSMEKNIDDNTSGSGGSTRGGTMWNSRGGQSGANRDLEYRQNGHQRSTPRSGMEDDEGWMQRRKQTHERAQELAKIRREEEERKFMETKMAANKKLLALEQKISAKKNSTSSQDIVKDSSSDNSMSSGSNQDSHSSGLHQLSGSISSDGLEFRQMSQIGNGGPSTVSGRGFVQWNAAVQEQQSAGGDREPRLGTAPTGRDLDSGGGGGAGPVGGGGGPNFSKQFQIDLPPRFRNQAEKNHIGGQRGGNIDKANNVPFAQQYDTRWVHPPAQTYTKSSSMSGVQSGANNNTMSRRAPSADDVAQQHRGSNNNLTSNNLQQYQNSGRQQSGHSLNRSMSDTSQRKLSVSSEDRSSTTSSHNLAEGSPPKSELKTSESCREFGSSWADEPLENEKLLYGNNKIEDDRKSLKDSENNEMIKLSDKQSWPDSAKHTVDVSLKNANNNKLNETSSSNKQTVEITQVSISKNNDIKTDKEMLNEDYRSGRDSGTNKRMSPKAGSRQMGSRGGRNFDNFRRGQDQSGASNLSSGGARKNLGGGRARGVGGHSGGDHAWSETDGSEDHEEDRKNRGRRSPKQIQQQLMRDSNHHHQSQQQQQNAQNHHQQQQHGMQQRSTSSGSLKQEPRQPAERSNTQTSLRGSSHQEGFAPRGEPSRRGRGSAYRTSRGAMKNVDYGPPRRTFGGDDKPRNESSSGDSQGLTSDDRTKLKQQALSAGIGISTSTVPTSTNNTSSSGNAIASNANRSSGSGNVTKSSSTGSSGSSRIRSGGRGKNTSGKNSDEAWDTTSDHSESGGTGGQGKRRENREKERDRGHSRSAKPRNERKNNNVAQNKNLPNQSAGKPEDVKKSSENTSVQGTQQSNTNTGNKKDALEGIDLNNFASVVVIDEQLEKNCSTQSSSGQQSSSDGDGFQEVRNKKGTKKNEEPVTSSSTSSNQPPNLTQQTVVPASGQQTSQQQNQTRSSSNRGEKKERSSSKGSSNKNVQNKQPGGNAINISSQQQQPQSNTSNTTSKSQSDRPRQSKLPPRLARQKENIRMQRAQAQDNVMAPMPAVNAWDKPITASLRPNIESDNAMTIDSEAIVNITNESGQSSQRSTPGTNTDAKLAPGKSQTDPKSSLDGTTPPVQTIIFENTNFKSGPNNQTNAVKRSEKRSESDIFIKASGLDIIDTTTPVSRDGQLSGLQLSFQTKTEADYDKDMKLSFNFDSDLAQLTEDKNTKGLGLPRSMHSSSSQSTISPSTAELNLKIQSVKKVWENAPVMPTVLEQQTSNEDTQHNLSSPHNLGSHQGQHNLSKHQAHPNLNQMNQMASQAHTHNHGLVGPGHNLTSQHNLSPAATYASTFGGDPSMEHFGKCSDGNDTENVYSTGPQHVTAYNHVPQMNKHNDMNNVCKVKQPQSMHPSGLGAISGGSQGLGLSPPPSLQQQQAPQQQYYQAAQYGGMSAIPSPPAVLFNSTAAAMLGSSQLPPQQQQQQLYGAAAFQMEQGRGGYSQFPGHFAGANAPYNYMQTTPNLPQPTPDMYQSLTSQYRAMGGAPFGQSQQINNPSTVLISSTSNSLMSASVKPSNQIGAIGSKSGAAGPGHYAPQQPPQYMSVTYQPPPQAGPLAGGSSYFGGAASSAGGAGSAGGSQGGSQGAGSGAGGGSGFYAAPAGAAPGGFSLAAAAAAAGMFGGNPAQPPPGPPQAQVQGQGFGSQFLSSPLQLAATMQQYRGGPQSGYLKNLPDPCSRPLKSPIGYAGQQQQQWWCVSNDASSGGTGGAGSGGGGAIAPPSQQHLGGGASGGHHHHHQQQQWSAAAAAAAAAANRSTLPRPDSETNNQHRSGGVSSHASNASASNAASAAPTSSGASSSGNGGTGAKWGATATAAAKGTAVHQA
uniref:Putative mediator of rna polymerase ii transcription subunit 12-like isoform x3 n=1 Tax=Xenopsylla cheopis TaxID=163159 RepID=A0A6M2DUH9_XENCH